MRDLPATFESRMVQVLGSRQALEQTLQATSRRALRVNTLKTTLEAARARLDAMGIEHETVPFCKESLFYEDPQERGIGNLWEHQNGWLFSQDAASTLPVVALDPQPGERVLDLCSAPGGKTTHIAQRMGNQGLVVANDNNPGRVNNMISNLDRMGAMNVAVTSASGIRLRWPITFDKVLVDAPCSNLGCMHADWSPVYDYDPGLVGSKVGLQRLLLDTAFHAVRPGGTIVYSTCTLEPRENEEIVSWMLEHHPVTIERLDLGVGRPGLTEVGDQRFHGDVDKALRLHPGDAETDGFFLARFTKDEGTDWADGKRRDWGGGPFEAGPEGAVEGIVDTYGLDGSALQQARAVSTPSKLYATTVPDLEEALQLEPDRLGVYLAKREGNGYRMSFDAATAFGRGATRSIELDPDVARRWIRGDPAPAGDPEPWSVVTCQGEPLGCARTFGEEVPCFVPKVRRVPDKPGVCGFLAEDG